MSQHEFANDQYIYMEKFVELYEQLQDELSKEIFWARLQCDVDPGMDRAIQLARVGGAVKQTTWQEELAAAAAAGKKLVLYGAGAYGNGVAGLLTSSNIDFYAFCDQKKAGETLLDKPVLSPQELIANSGQYAVVISTVTYRDEISRFLVDSGFPMDSILSCSEFTSVTDGQYLEFPNLFRPGTAIVDAGCFDGENTIQFSQWCQGNYSKIYAFEPDEANYRRCEERLKAAGVPNVELLQAGMGRVTGEGDFVGALDASSYLKETISIRHNSPLTDLKHTTVKVCALDDVADVTIGLIKMDIEGAEFDALHGAEHVIQRDRPLLAICVYHRQGDMLAIMDYLHRLVPEYRFWLRHYGPLYCETVLYAAI